jgi:hypothetical protein
MRPVRNALVVPATGAGRGTHRRRASEARARVRVKAPLGGAPSTPSVEETEGRSGRTRVYFFGAIGGLLFGYDTGVIAAAIYANLVIGVINVALTYVANPLHRPARAQAAPPRRAGRHGGDRADRARPARAVDGGCLTSAGRDARQGVSPPPSLGSSPTTAPRPWAPASSAPCFPRAGSGGREACGPGARRCAPSNPRSCACRRWYSNRRPR